MKPQDEENQDEKDEEGTIFAAFIVPIPEEKTEEDNEAGYRDTKK